MSIGSIGSTTPAYLSQSLSTLLSQLSASTSAASATASTLLTPAPSNGQNTTGQSTTGQSNAPTPPLSAQVLNVLMAMQQDQGSSSGQTNPLQQLVSAMDTDGDGTVSQSEMESYIEQKGGTQAQADALFTSLNQNNAGNLTTAQLSTDLQQAGAGGGHHHHHHHHTDASSSAQASSPLLQALDASNTASQSADDSTTATSATSTPASGVQSILGDVEQAIVAGGTLMAIAA